MSNGEIVELLRSGEAFADLSHWRQVAVSGPDALEWLDDLVTADLSDLAPGQARHALFLTPTGGVRASFTVAVPGGDLLLVQDPTQAKGIQELLEPYILSSDVALEDRTGKLVIVAFPGPTEAPDPPGTARSAPSCLGAGADLIAPAGDHDFLLRSLSEAYVHAGNEEVEGDLPQESGLSGAVSRDKGCFPGQEAVAKVDTFGHPRRLVLPLEAEGPASPGDAVLLDGSEVGEVTSAAALGSRTLVLARLRWEARNGRLRTGLGTELRRRAA